MKPWLRAGLIGAAILVVLALVSLIPAVGACCCCAWPLVYLLIGALAGSFVPPVRDSGTAAGQGALAAALAQLLGGGVYTVIVTIQSASTDVSQAFSELTKAWQSAGLDTTTLQTALDNAPPWLTGKSGGLIAGLASGGMCLVGGLIVAAILGALGGLVFASIKRE
jgi:hypothetical protein